MQGRGAAEQWGHEPGRQLKLKSSSDDRLMPGWGPAGAMYADSGYKGRQTYYKLLHTATYYTNEYREPRNILEVKNI